MVINQFMTTFLNIGSYETHIKNDGKRFANSIAPLSGGRVFISRLSSEISLTSLTIALRYAAARRQFGPTGMLCRNFDQ